MALPSFKYMRERRKERQQEKASSSNDGVLREASDQTGTSTTYPGVDVKRATRIRRNSIVASSVFFFLAVIFLILVIIGNTHIQPVLTSTYFLKLDLTNIFPQSVPDPVFINSIARSLGLRDFYQVGLWNFCEGYNDEGVTSCSKPVNMYWFNPVEILLNELLAGASIALPTEVITILNVVKLASNLMFGFFAIGIILNFLAIPICYLALYSRLWSVAVLPLTFITALFTTAATIIATVMFTIFRNVFTSQPGLNIGANLGINMFVFMWVATACSLSAFGTQLCLACCCASRRDVITGRKRGSKHAYKDVGVSVKSTVRRRLFGSRKTAAEET